MPRLAQGTRLDAIQRTRPRSLARPIPLLPRHAGAVAPHSGPADTLLSGDDTAAGRAPIPRPGQRLTAATCSLSAPRGFRYFALTLSLAEEHAHSVNTFEFCGEAREHCTLHPRGRASHPMHLDRDRSSLSSQPSAATINGDSGCQIPPSSVHLPILRPSQEQSS